MENGAELEPRADGWENRWPALLTLVLVIALQFLARDAFTEEASKILLVLIPTELVLLIVLALFNDHSRKPIVPVRAASIGLTLLAAIYNIVCSGFLIYHLLWKQDDVTSNARTLLGTGVAVFVTNMIVCGLLYWEMDRGGPYYRWWENLPEHQSDEPEHRWHFLFAQDANPEVKQKMKDPNWRPRLGDYLYLGFTNVVAFSPADTMPLTKPAKIMMTAQSAIALATLAVVLARAVGVIGTPPADPKPAPNPIAAVSSAPSPPPSR